MKVIHRAMYRGLVPRPLTLPLLASIIGLWIGWFGVPESGWAVDVLTQHNDQWRTGSNQSETILTTTGVASPNFGKLYTYMVHGYVYAQPLYVSGLTIAGGRRNLLFVATMEDDVYAFDADTNLTYWHKQYTGGQITPVPIADIAGRNDLNIHGNVGILSTPVIDKVSSTIYLLARTKDTSNATYLQTLHALDLVTGNEKFGGPVTIHPPGFNTKTQNQRPGLALANGQIYICWGSHEDIMPYNGYIMTFDAATLALKRVFNVTAGGGKGALWQSGQAPAFDDEGNLYVTSGNGDWNGTTQWGQTCLKLAPDFRVLDWCTPVNYAAMNAGDTDFGAAGCLLLPGQTGYPSTSYVVTGGKDGKLFVMDKERGMGHQSPGDAKVHQIWQVVQSAAKCSVHIHGSPIYWDSSTRGQMMYLWGENDRGKAYKFDGSKFDGAPLMKTAVTSPITGCGMPGGLLSLSASGNTNGIVWASCVYTGDAVHDIVPGILRAYDANDLGIELWNSYQNKPRDDFGKLAKYVPPTIANGKVYMASFSNTVCAYGLLNTYKPVLADGTYKIINRKSGLALGVAAGSTANSVNVGQERYTGADSQKWTFTSLGGGYYKMVGMGSGKALDVTAGSTASGALIDIYPYASQANQQWVVAPTLTAGCYTVQGAQSGLFLDVLNASVDPGAGAIQAQGTDGGTQDWFLQTP